MDFLPFAEQFSEKPFHAHIMKRNFQNFERFGLERGGQKPESLIREAAKATGTSPREHNFRPPHQGLKYSSPRAMTTL